MTYKQLVDEVLADAFPEDIAPNLEPIYRKRVLDGLIELQQLVKELKARQWTLYEFNGTLYRQGLTSIPRPAGRVKNVCVFNSRTLKDVVYYTLTTKEAIDRLISVSAIHQDYPDAVSYPSIGYYRPSSTLDRGYRANTGWFCVDRDEILITPSIESYERILVEWSGSKTSYTDSDIVDFGKYERQVVASLIFWVKREAARFEDRSQTDYSAMNRGWKDAVTSLIIDCKEDAEAELPMEDDLSVTQLGITTSADVVPVTSIGATLTDPAWFNRLWMLCTDNNKLYNVGPLLVDGQVQSDVTGDGVDYSPAEVTFEAIRADNIWVKASDENFYKLTVALVDGSPVHGYDPTGSDGDGETVLDDISTVYVDVFCADDDKYYRLRLSLVNGVPTLVLSEAPDEVDYPPIVTQDDIIGVLKMRDATTGQVVYIRVKNGQISMMDQ